MPYEVEQKYRVADLSAVERQLDPLGPKWAAAVQQHDTYFAHPVRDFSVTDEALRIRTVGQDNSITYKGPKLDTLTKTRLEIELAIAGDAPSADASREMLIELSFRPVADVRKRRRSARIDWQGRPWQVALDEVDRLGTFVELELVVGQSELDSARAALLALAGHLDLTSAERRSYLELLLAADVDMATDS